MSEKTTQPVDDHQLPEAPFACSLVPVLCKGQIVDGKAWPLVEGSNVLGRRAVPRLGSKAMSREHLNIELRGRGELHFEDLDSRNGVWVDGVQAVRGSLVHQSLVRTGDVVWVVSVERADVGHPDVPRDLVVKAASTRMAFRHVQQVAPYDTSVLILGPTGCGKESLARQIHALSRRAKGPFVAVNSGAIPPSLLHSALFGHVKGAFSGAIDDKIGHVQEADGGTLFLDEIGDMLEPVQVALLRVFQERKFQRLGEVKQQPCNLRIVAATNQPLETRQATGQFRSDLFGRIAAFVIYADPLAVRREEILLLIRHWWGKRFNHSGPRLAIAAAEALLRHGWPRNVRDVQNLAERLYLKGKPDEVLSLDFVRECLADGGDKNPAVAAGVSVHPEQLTKLDWERLLEKHNGNKSAVARELGLSERMVYYYVQEQHGIDPKPFKPGAARRNGGRRG